MDFYDGSIMYDFLTDATTICDIDFFRKTPRQISQQESIEQIMRIWVKYDR